MTVSDVSKAIAQVRATVDHESSTGPLRQLTLDRAPEPVPLESDRQGEQAAKYQSADRDRQWPNAPSSQHLRDAGHQLRL
jgi:hypothetical protein